MPTGNVYDSRNLPAVLGLALEHADLDCWRAEQARARQEGRYIGIGLATAQQRSTYSSTEFWFHNPGPATGLTSTPESVRIGVGPTGGITVTIVSPFWGNTPGTMGAPGASQELGIRTGTVKFTYCNTTHTP